jgi:hypothetical protein
MIVVSVVCVFVATVCCVARVYAKCFVIRIPMFDDGEYIRKYRCIFWGFSQLTLSPYYWDSYVPPSVFLCLSWL